MATIRIEKMETGGGWRFQVKVDEGASGTTHEVTLQRADRERLAEAVDPALLVRASFEFLLEREPKEAIMRSFDLMVIGRYFPEFEEEIRRRV